MGHDLHTCKCVRQMGASNMGDANVPPFRTSCSVQSAVPKVPSAVTLTRRPREQIEVDSDRNEPSALKRRLTEIN